jgi:hypothetical protein
MLKRVLTRANWQKCTGANEYYSGFDNIGHNPLNDLILLWIIPKCVHLFLLNINLNCEPKREK